MGPKYGEISIKKYIMGFSDHPVKFLKKGHFKEGRSQNKG
jgi:hypothetical protein